jgi:hypothetical protein
MPSTAAKINFLLGLKPTPQDVTLGKYLNENPFKQTFLSLTSLSTEIRQPVPLFNLLTNEQADSWREKFRGNEAPK